MKALDPELSLVTPLHHINNMPRRRKPRITHWSASFPTSSSLLVAPFRYGSQIPWLPMPQKHETKEATGPCSQHALRADIAVRRAQVCRSIFEGLLRRRHACIEKLFPAERRGGEKRRAKQERRVRKTKARREKGQARREKGIDQNELLSINSSSTGYY